jgi:hypothetical protein
MNQSHHERKWKILLRTELNESVTKGDEAYIPSFISNRLGHMALSYWLSVASCTQLAL